MDRTSQLSRIAQRPAATDLSGGKTSEALSTVRRNNLAAEDVVCFQSDLFDCKDKLELGCNPASGSGAGMARFGGGGCRGEELEWSDPPLPTSAGRSSLLPPIFDSFSFAFFRNPERVCRKLMSLQDRCGYVDGGVIRKPLDTWLSSIPFDSSASPQRLARI